MSRDQIPKEINPIVIIKKMKKSETDLNDNISLENSDNVSRKTVTNVEEIKSLENDILNEKMTRMKLLERAKSVLIAQEKLKGELKKVDKCFPKTIHHKANFCSDHHNLFLTLSSCTELRSSTR